VVVCYDVLGGSPVEVRGCFGLALLSLASGSF